MSNIDEQIVNMRFNNTEFEKKIWATISSLDNLKKGLKLDGATKGLDDVAASAKKLSLSSISDALDTVASKFTATSAIAVTALANIANRAVNAGVNLVKSLSITPILDGLREYETTLNSVQTILANTGLSGQKGLDQVNGALKILNDYSDQTIYNFAEMARNIGTFTAAGIKLDVATGAIKGIANLAALSGSNAEQASTAMYQLSQALAAGRVSLMDWNSVVNAGMGGKVFQEALKTTARAHGVAVDSIIKKEGSFRDSLQKGWITSSILTETLNKFTGDLTEKQLKALGYNKQQIAEIIQMGKVAKDAATKVKTISQLIGTLQEAVSSGWSQTWQLIFGDFEEARTLFTGVNNVLSAFIQHSSEARNKVLSDWKALGGRTVLIEAIGNAFNAIIALVKPIRDAFRQIFPETTGKQLFELSLALRNFTANLKIGADTANKIKRTFAGFFAVIHIGKTILVEGIKLLLRLFGTAAEGTSSFLDATASIGDFLVRLDQAISKGGVATKIFTKIGDVLVPIIQAFKNVGSAILGAFNGIDFGKIGTGLDGVANKFTTVSGISKIIIEAWKKVFGVLDNVWGHFKDFASRVVDLSGALGEVIARGLTNVDVGDVLAVINTGLFAALVFGIRKFFNKIVGAFGEESKAISLISTIEEAFGQLTSTLKSMQTTLKATTLLEIAIAIGILTLSVDKLSKIDSNKLASALTAMGVMFGQLFASMLIFERLSKGGGIIKMPVVAAGMILLATAINILASAVKKLADLKYDNLQQGLMGVAVLLGALASVAKPLSANSKGLISAGLGVVVLSVGIKILAGAVKDLGDLNWDQLAKGLIGVGTILGSLGLFTKFSSVNQMGIGSGAGIVLIGVAIKILASAVSDLGNLDPAQLTKGVAGVTGILAAVALFSQRLGKADSLVASGAALILIAASMKIFASAIADFGNFDWETIGKGLIAMAGALGIIAGALAIMPPSTILSAGAILVVAASLNTLGTALQMFGSMGWETIAKALIVLGGSLVIIADSMRAMTSALPGAAALLVVAAALSLLVPVLQSLGSMSWGDIVTGLATLAGVLAILGSAAALLTPVIPALMGLGVAIALIGVGALAAGVGLLAFSAGIAALGVAAAVGTSAIVAMITAIINLIPMAMVALAKGIIAFAEVISRGGPSLVKAITTVLLSLLTSIETLAPKIVGTLYKLVVLLLQVLVDAIPKMVDAGLKMIAGILQGIANNIQKVVELALKIVANFIKGISDGLKDVIDAGVKLIISFVNGVADGIRNNSEAMGKAGGNLATAMVEGMVKGLGAGVREVIRAAEGLAKSALDAAKNLLGIHSPSREFEKIGKFVNEGFIKGLTGRSRDKVDSAVGNLKTLLSDAMKSATADVDSAEKKLNKLTHARKKDRQAIADTRAELAQARKELALTSNAHSVLTRYLNDEQRSLDNLADRYQALQDRLEQAQNALKDAIQTRNDYADNVKGNFLSLPNIAKDTELKNYVTDLKQQISDVQTFAVAIQDLRRLGLSDSLYKEFLAKGVDALPLVKQIVAGGQNSVNELNTLNAILDQAASSLGVTASHSLYDAGVQAAQGLVDGLKASEIIIVNQMNALAAQMVNAIKKQLQIKSPSRVFAEIGAFSVEGLARGMDNSASLAEASATGIGRSAILAMSKSIVGMADLVNGEMNLSPVITPVLDLTAVRTDAQRLTGMLGSTSMGASVSYGQAASISASTSNLSTISTDTNSGQNRSVQFVQNNYSPKSLSTVEIYRQTKNQLSLAKGALT